MMEKGRISKYSSSLSLDLGLNDPCVPDPPTHPVPPGPGPAPRPFGAGKRSKVGELGDDPPPCLEGLVCREVMLREYVCAEEITTGEFCFVEIYEC